VTQVSTATWRSSITSTTNGRELVAQTSCSIVLTICLRIGLSILANGRTFVCYTRGDYAYTLGEVTNRTAEAAYPSEELNTPPGGLATSINGYLFGSNSTTHFINVQASVLSSKY
jgi:hypothetical protein